MTIPKRLLLVSFAVFLSMAGPRDAWAQTAGGLGGWILDGHGRPVQGATITVLDPGRGISLRAVTDARGEFRVLALRPGPAYSLRVSAPGMATLELPGITVHAGRVTDVTLTLVPEGEVRERVRVVERPVLIDPDQTGTRTGFSAEFIDLLPILGRNYQDVLTLAPGVSDIDGDGNPNIHGARDTDVRTLVDGVSTVDPLTGKVGQQLNIESIEEIEVKTSGASAEFGRGQGAFVTIVTKSGGNEFEGNFKFFWRGDLLDRDGAGVDDPRIHGGLGNRSPRDLEFNDSRSFLSLSGPIRRDRAWFYATAEAVQIEEPVNATFQTYVKGTRERRAFGKLSWDISSSHRLSFTATIDPRKDDNLGIDSRTAVESGYTLKEGGVNLVLKETAIFSPTVSLETTLQHFRTKPGLVPTLSADTNHNGILFIDRDGNGRIDAVERDPGEDWDGDGAWDVFEKDSDGDGQADAGEDRDGDGRITAAEVGCEGIDREDRDCDGHLDDVDEDLNDNGRLDGAEDRDDDNRLDDGTEDRNRNGRLDDRPFPRPEDVLFQRQPDGTTVPLPASYPYASFLPLPPDRDYRQDGAGRTSGPFYLDEKGRLGRVTVRQDLSIFVPERRGQHDLKIGGIVERETYAQSTTVRPVVFRPERDRQSGQQVPPVGVLISLDGGASNFASGLSLGAYAQESYRPLPNLTLNLGMRFDHETTDSFGYTVFDPAAERSLYDRLWALGGGERGRSDLFGNGDGIASAGVGSDPIFPFGDASLADHEDTAALGNLLRIARSRLSQHHGVTSLVAESLAELFPEAVTYDPDTGERFFDREVLRERGHATFQEKEAFRLTNDNLAPRLGLSWDPWSGSRTRVYASWGRFYDKVFLDAVVQEEGPETIFRTYAGDADGVNQDGTPNNGLGAPVSKAPENIFQVDRGLQTPFSDELALGFEREIVPEVSLGITFIDRRYRQQLQDQDVNHGRRYGNDGKPLDVLGDLAINLGSKSRSFKIVRLKDGRPDLYIHNFFFNRVLRVGNLNEARYKAVVIALDRRLSRRWQMNASYVYSRAIGHAEEFLSPLGDDPATVEDEFGYLDYDQRHVVKINAAAYLPGDWQIAGTLSWSSGLPFSIADTFVALDNFDYGQVRTVYGYVGDDERGKPAFVPVRRNSLRNNAVTNIDLRAQKALVIGRWSSKLFLTVQNLLNQDDLRILVDDRSGSAQIPSVDAERRFGRRFEIGFQIEF